MGKFYKDKNKDSTKNLFEQRTLYRNEMTIKNQKHIVDFFEAEKILYGRISPNFEPISIKQNRLTTVPGATPESVLEVADFVGDMFTRLSNVFKKSVMSGQISADDPYLSLLLAHKGLERPQQKYEQYRLIYYKAIAQKFRQQNVKVKDFDHFMKNLFNVVGGAFATQPLTYCGFIKSAQCSTLSTGLAIEIADLKYDNDSEKIQKFTQSKNWDFYVNACNSFGFMIDLT